MKALERTIKRGPENLKKLVNKSVHWLREAESIFKNPCILFSGGKDSTLVLHLCRLAYFGKIPYDVIFLDTGFQPEETHNYIDNLSEQWGFNLIRAENVEAKLDGVNPDSSGKRKCCHLLKTEALNQIIRKNGYDAVITSIRWDEENMRSRELYFSYRFRRDPKHVRVHPILHWRLEDVWSYTETKKLPINPMYNYVTEDGKVYKSLGCYTCTFPVSIDAPERGGRDNTKEEIMEALRSLGYM